jgi:chromosomal replication initiation ATPase DnaA
MRRVFSLWRGAMIVPEVSRASIVAEAARDHGLSLADLTDPRRRRRLARARWDAMWRLAQVLRPDGSRVWSYPRIARAVGLTDHTSAGYGIRRWAELMAAEGVR